MLPSPYAKLISRWQSAHASGVVPPLGEASPHQWAMACHEMFEAGNVEVLEYAARHLHEAYPDVDYLATMVAWFDAVPRHLPPPLAFRDQRGAEVQIVQNNGSEAVLLCFCAAQGTLGLPLDFVHQWLGRLPVSLVYIKDFRDLSGALGFPPLAPDRAGSIVALRRIAAELGGKRIYTLGVSLGGYAAMYYGLELGATGILNLAGATDLTLDFVNQIGSVPWVYSSLLRLAPDYAKNLRDAYVAAGQGPRTLIAFNSGFPRDRQQAERMAGVPNVELIALTSAAKHNVVDELIRQGKFADLLQRLLAGENAGP
jgi:hypothetical protein